MAQLNVPMIDPCRYKSVKNNGAGEISANLVLVADSGADRAVKVPATSAVVRDFAGVSFRDIAAGADGEILVCEGDTAVCKASGAITRGDRVYVDTASGKEGYVKKYTDFRTDGAQLIVGVAKTTAADGELLEVELHPHTVGDGFQAGTAQLVSGTVTVTGVRIAATTVRIMLTKNTPSGTAGHLSAPAASRSTGGQFVINSSTNTDESTVDWLIIGS